MAFDYQSYVYDYLLFERTRQIIYKIKYHPWNEEKIELNRLGKGDASGCSSLVFPPACVHCSLVTNGENKFSPQKILKVCTDQLAELEMLIIHR